MYRRICRSGRAVVALAALIVAACGGGTTSNAPAGSNAAAPVTNPVKPETAGAITGKIVFDGTAPKPEPIRMTSDPKCQSDGGPAANEAIVVGDGGGLQNVFVY